ncbi:MAG: M23 family metallopeptidase [Acidimicrobiia bacterium]|nr:M23 family metallopeptidase [Acidimicrobiia bacterium]
MMLTVLIALCLALPPVDGLVVADFEPGAGFSGHWGVDIETAPGSEVRSPASGIVTFAGRVAGMQSVTILVGERVRVSLSYLSSIEVSTGERVAAGEVIARSGLAHGEAAVHLSVRMGSSYVDPVPYLQCRSGTIRLLLDR